jgi:hypothetical protein
MKARAPSSSGGGGKDAADTVSPFSQLHHSFASTGAGGLKMLEVNERTGIFPALAHAISARSATGYVGLPLAPATARSGFQTIGFDIDPEKIGQLNRGCSYIDSVGSEQLSGLVRHQGAGWPRVARAMASRRRRLQPAG